MTQQFNLDEALELIIQSDRIDSKDGVLAPLIKQVNFIVQKVLKVCENL